MGALGGHLGALGLYLGALLSLLGLILALLPSTWRFLSIFGASRDAPTLENHRFSLVKLRFFIKSQFSSWTALGTLLEPSWDSLGMLLGPSWGPLGSLLAALGRSWGALGVLLGALGALLGRSWAHLCALGRFWAPLGTPGRVPRASRDSFWDDFGTLWGRFGDDLGRNLGTT